MDTLVYSLLNKKIKAVSTGVESVEVSGTSLIFTFKDGTTSTVTFPTPADGRSVKSVEVNSSNHLICKMSDGASIDAGELPSMNIDASLNENSSNAIQNQAVYKGLEKKQNKLAAGKNISINSENNEISAADGITDYNDLNNKPTKLSAFINDPEFIDNTVQNLLNYYSKQDTYNKTEVNQLISSVAKLTCEIYEKLEDITNPKTGIIYLVGTESPYAQYMYINSELGMIGLSSIDLSDYYNKSVIDDKLASKVDAETGKGLSTNDFTNAYKEQLDNYSVDASLSDSSENPVQNKAIKAAIDGKADSSNVYNKTEIDNKLSEYPVIDDTEQSDVKVYSSKHVDSLIEGLTGFTTKVVEELPTSNIDPHCIYFVPSSTTTEQNLYDEFIYVESEAKWEKVGSTVQKGMTVTPLTQDEYDALTEYDENTVYLIKEEE